MPSFEKRNRYGFEMVDAPDATLTIAQPASIENLRRIKSFGFFTNFPRFSFNPDTCGLSARFKKRVDCEINRNGMKKTGSRDVFPASHGILARTGAGAAAQREDAGIGEAAAGRRLRGGIGGDGRGVGHEPVLQTSA